MFRWFWILNLCSELARGNGYHDPQWFSLTSWASFHYISTLVVYSVFEWEQSSRDYLLSCVNSLWNWLRSLFYASCNHGNWKQFQCNRGLSLWPCPCDLNLVIDWHTNNLSRLDTQISFWCLRRLTRSSSTIS